MMVIDQAQEDMMPLAASQHKEMSIRKKDKITECMKIVRKGDKLNSSMDEINK